MMLHNLSIGELAERLNSREISSVELTRHLLSRIDSFGSTLNALITVTASQALASAAAADKRLAATSGWCGDFLVQAGVRNVFELEE